jgi:uncharacterized protein
MVIALAGYNGFIGKNIRKAFVEDEFILLNRKDLYDSAETLAEKLKGSEIVINTAGFPVSVRWTRKNRREIFNSRILVTRNIVSAINILKNKPIKFINTSAIGIYSQDKEHTEIDYSYDDNFLSEVVKAWEREAEKVSQEVNLIKMRLGLVLGRDGGALPPLMRMFNYGLGGIIASGRQVYSFIHIVDVIDALRFLLENEGEGVYNFTAPNPVTNREFTHTIAKNMNRPVLFWVPGIAMKMVMGKSAILVTGGQTVYPKKLLDEGYSFTFASIDQAIENLVKRL